MDHFVNQFLDVCSRGRILDLRRILVDSVCEKFPWEEGLFAALSRYDYDNAEEIVRLLLDKCTTFSVGENGVGKETVLHRACASSSARIVALLLERSDGKALCNAKTHENMTCLALSSRRSNHAMACEISTMLLDKGAIMMPCGYSGSFPLARAARANNFELVKLFLRYGAVPTECDIDGFTTVHWAAKYASSAVLEVLINQSPDLVNAKSVEGFRCHLCVCCVLFFLFLLRIFSALSRVFPRRSRGCCGCVFLVGPRSGA
jgi:hypothetical protein